MIVRREEVFINNGSMDVPETWMCFQRICATPFSENK